MMYEQQPDRVADIMTMRKKSKTRNERSSSYSSPSRSSIEEESFESVDLSGLSLETLHSPSVNLAIISKLDISNNNLQVIPESLIARLLNVVTLDVHSNELKTLPNSIGCLSKLKVLNVAGNYLDSLPKTIENCRSLEELNANFNKLSRLPDTIGFELINLKKLLISSNKLVFLPYSLSHLTNLRILDARLNCLRSLPEDMENLTNLQVLNLSQNFQYLETLPYSIGLLLSLVELDVSYNKITVLPESIGCLQKLEKLSVEGNPLTSPPMDVVEHGLRAVKEYLSVKMNAGQSPPKKKSWIGKLVRYRTFNGNSPNQRGISNMSGHPDEREGFFSDYRTISGLASPRYMGMFSPRRLFSPKTHFSR